MTDLEINNQEIKADSEEITKVILRYLSGINKLYHYINKMGKIEIVNEETGKPNMILTTEQMKVIEHNFLKLRKAQVNLLLHQERGKLELRLTSASAPSCGSVFHLH